MADSFLISMLTEPFNEWNEWRAANPQEPIDLRSANLTKAYLEYKNLRGADLRDADLSDCYLSEADFSYADMRGATLCLSECMRTVCKGANLENAVLAGTYFEVSDFREANLSRVLFHDVQGFACAEFESCDFRGARFTTVNDSESDGSYLGFASCGLIETCSFDTDVFLCQYIAQALEFAQNHRLKERQEYPDWFDKTIKRIQALQTLYKESDPPRELVEVVQHISAQLLLYLKHHPNELSAIRPRQFEELVAEILASFGWTVHLTPYTKDGGFDIYAISRNVLGATSSWLIECKKPTRQNKKIGVDIARALYGVKAMLGTTYAMLATTSYFTKGVHEMKTSLYDFELRDYLGIVEWLNQYRPHADGRLHVRNNRLVMPNEVKRDRRGKKA